MKLLTNKRSLLRYALGVVFGLLLIIVGVYYGVVRGTQSLHKPFLYGLFGLLCIFLGMILLVDRILSYLERESDK